MMKKIKMERTFSELIKYKTFEERFDYLKLSGEVGTKTFGYDRWMNQRFYSSRQWLIIRDHVIVRDNGCDLSFFGREIYDRIYIHHMNPMSIQDFDFSNPAMLDPEFLITTCYNTHAAIHYGNKERLTRLPIKRRPGDTRLW